MTVMVDNHPLGSDRDWIRDAAHQAGTTLSDEPLPREIDDEGRIWVVCTCGARVLLEDSVDDEDS